MDDVHEDNHVCLHSSPNDLTLPMTHGRRACQTPAEDTEIPPGAGQAEMSHPIKPDLSGNPFRLNGENQKSAIFVDIEHFDVHVHLPHVPETSHSCYVLRKMISPYRSFSHCIAILGRTKEVHQNTGLILIRRTGKKGLRVGQTVPTAMSGSVPRRPRTRPCGRR